MWGRGSDFYFIRIILRLCGFGYIMFRYLGELGCVFLLGFLDVGLGWSGGLGMVLDVVTDCCSGWGGGGGTFLFKCEI